METPLAPIPDGAAPTAPRRRPVPEKRARRADRATGPGSGGALRAGLGFVAASWRVLLFILLVQFVLALTVVLPFYLTVAGELDSHPHASALAGSPTAYEQTLPAWSEGGLDPGLWRDIQRKHEALFAGLTVTQFWMAFVAWLFGALVAGGLLGAAASGENPVRVGAFLTHGARMYGPMLRVGVCFALAYYVVARLVFEAWDATAASAEFMASSQGAEFWGDRAREAVAVLCFCWLRVAADLARARLVVRGSRGAVGAFLGGLGRALRPRAWLAALAIGVPTYVLLVGLGLASQSLGGDDTWTLIALFVVVQLAVLLRWAGRAALLCSFTRLEGPPRTG
ncbi:MAG: hypothetical protein O2894_04560 [Planctomycetota bacterium]|nr:hypothetical protein [Planctomycetota bacterium]